MAGVVGRESGAARLDVVDRADGATLEMAVEDTALEGTTVYTDECTGYNGLSGRHRNRVPISHAGPRSE